MKLVRLKLTQFKNFSSSEFVFRDHNLLIGKNGAGKSAIKDAIIFLLYNRTADGSLSDSSKFIAYNQPKCEVEAEFDNGMIIRRERTEKTTRITHIDNSQSLEDSTITQRELESMIPSFQIFNCVFNVGSFMSLDDKEKRDIVLSFTKPVDKKAIYIQLGGKDEWIERYKLNIDDCKFTHKMLLHNKKLLVDDVTMSLGKVSVLSQPIDIPEPEKEDVSDKIAELESSIKEFNKFEKDKAVYIRDKRAAENQEVLNEESKKKIETLKESITGKVRPSQERRHSLQNEISRLEMKVIKYAKFPNEALCPSCEQVIPDTHRHLVSEEVEHAKEKIAKLKNEISEEIKKIDLLEKEYQSEQDTIRSIEVLESSIKEVSYPKEIAVVSKPNVKLFDELKKQQTEYLAEQQYIKRLQSDEIERQNSFQSLMDKIEKSKAVIKDIEVLIPIFSHIGMPSMEMKIKVVSVNTILQKYIPKSQIETLELLKNGMDTREVFDIRINGKEYKKLSTGERLKTDIAISETLDELSGFQVGMKFVDNGECIDHDPKISPQSFIAKVTVDNQLKII